MGCNDGGKAMNGSYDGGWKATMVGYGVGGG
jgi:hypothetical protein